jgi:Flp pilus assembly protein TadD
MNQLTVEEWKVFLKARMAQEAGNDQEALTAFDQLLEARPDNPHLMSSRAFALQRLGRKDEAAANHIAAKYAVMSQSLTAAADKPEAWTSGLKSLLANVEKLDSGAALSAVMVAW